MGKSKKIVIPLDGIPTQNQIVNSNRTNRFAGAKQKKNATTFCQMHIQRAMLDGFEIKTLPVDLEFVFYCKNRRTDKDNLASGALKFILDGAQKAGLIENDNWKHIGDWSCRFEIDKEFPRVEIFEANKAPVSD